MDLDWTLHLPGTLGTLVFLGVIGGIIYFGVRAYDRGREEDFEKRDN